MGTTGNKHPLFDKPYLSYFLLLLLVTTVIQFGNIGDVVLAFFLPGYAMMYLFDTVPIAVGIFTGASALLPILIFKLVFTKEFKGLMNPSGVKDGLWLMLPVILLSITGSVVAMTSCGVTTPYGMFIAVLRCIAPGISEEMMFRGLGVSNIMRCAKDEKSILRITMISSILFGLSHMSNIVLGASFEVSLIQCVYAIGVGTVLCAAYLRTGSLLSIITAHALIDLVELIRADYSLSGGVMTGIGTGDWIILISGALGIFWALFLIRKSKRSDIIRVWQDRWGKPNIPPYETETGLQEGEN